MIITKYEECNKIKNVQLMYFYYKNILFNPLKHRKNIWYRKEKMETERVNKLTQLVLNS